MKNPIVSDNGDRFKPVPIIAMQEFDALIAQTRKQDKEADLRQSERAQLRF
jgi:hypothetical protein